MVIAIKPEHRDNLEKLAKYLERLPKDYDQFDMRDFMAEKMEPGRFVDYHYVPKPPSVGMLSVSRTCGAVACAIGHGPDAGIPLTNRDRHWRGYARRVFGCDDSFRELGVYIFNAKWRFEQNGHRSAAARIWYVLDNGCAPPNWSYYDDIYRVY